MIHPEEILENKLELIFEMGCIPDPEIDSYAYSNCVAMIMIENLKQIS
jgi:hypothetical protein